MNRLNGTCLCVSVCVCVWERETCTYRVKRMQDSWTVSLYRNIHTNTLIRISKHWNSIALLHVFFFFFFSPCFPPNTPSIFEGALPCSAFVTDPAAQEGFLERVTPQTEELHPHWSSYIDPLRHLLAFTSFFCIFCSSWLCGQKSEILLAEFGFLLDRVSLNIVKRKEKNNHHANCLNTTKLTGLSLWNL